MIIVGKTERGLQCLKILGADSVALVTNLQGIPIQSYDAVVICTSNESKFQCARYALVNNKHVFMTAPLWVNNADQIDELEQLAFKNQVMLHISNPLRFNTQFSAAQQFIASKQLGTIQFCRVAYSSTIDKKRDGAMLDLMPYLLDLMQFWFDLDHTQYNFNTIFKDAEGKHAIIADFYADMRIELAANFLHKRTELTVEIYAEHDTINFSYQPALSITIQQEINYFMQLCSIVPLQTNCSYAKWIFTELDRLSSEQILLA